MNEISKFNENGEIAIPHVENPYEQVIDSIMGSAFLPRVQLYTGKSEHVMAKKIPMDHFGFTTTRDNITDLGEEVDVLVVTYRPRAIDTSDKSNIRASSNMASPLFKEIMARSFEQNSGCQYGPEYLLWVPSMDSFATFLMGGKTTRNEAKIFHQLLKKPATLKSKLIRTKEYAYMSPYGVPCDPSKIKSLPDPIKASEVMNDFLNPPEQTGAEVVTGVPQVER